MSAIREQVNDILITKFEVDESLLNNESISFEELQLDSLDVADMIIELEVRSNKKVDAKNLMKVKTLGDVYKAVEEIV